MKVFLILLFVGFTSAALQEKFQDETKNAVAAFVNGLETATPLHIALDVEDSKDVQRLERDIKEQLKKHIEEAFEKALKKIEDAIANKKEVNRKALEMLKDLRDKMKDFNIEDHEVKEGLEALKAKIDDHLKHILEKMGLFDKRTAEPEMPELLQFGIGDNIREMLSKLKKLILEKLDVKSLRDAIAKIIGQVSKKLCEWITTKGREKVMNFFDGLSGSDSEKKKRASEDHYGEIKDYLKNIEENIDNKLSKFKKWLHDLIDKAIDEAKEKFPKITEIVRQIIADGKNVSKKGLVDILEYIREFEDKFGSLYDVRNLIEELLKRND